MHTLMVYARDLIHFVVCKMSLNRKGMQLHLVHVTLLDIVTVTRFSYAKGLV